MAFFYKRSLGLVFYITNGKSFVMAFFEIFWVIHFAHHLIVSGLGLGTCGGRWNVYKKERRCLIKGSVGCLKFGFRYRFASLWLGIW